MDGKNYIVVCFHLDSVMNKKNNIVACEKWKICQNGNRKKYLAVRPSREYVYWEVSAAEEMSRQLKALPEEIKKLFPLQSQTRINFEFSYVNKQHWLDMDGALGGCFDAMQRAGLVLDDKYITPICADPVFGKSEVVMTVFLKDPVMSEKSDLKESLCPI